MTIKQGAKNLILSKIIAEVSRVVIGKDEIKELLLIALLSQGHVLIEGLPGTAKTTIARTFAQAIGGIFKRVQGTPDMLPADILGFYLYRPDGSSNFMPGPIFANVLLTDELNRTTPRTQAALLESMQEQQVTIERETHLLEQPFIVIASQIPYGGPGTSPLTEVQTDRFMFRIWSGLPSMEEENLMLQDIDAISKAHVSAVATTSDIIQLQKEVKKVHIADDVRIYILNIVDSLRHHQDVATGPSPRASITLFKGAKALAFVQGRDFVTPDDVKQLLVPALCHRLRISVEAEMEDVTPEAIITQVATEVPIPKGGAVSSTEDANKMVEETTGAPAITPDASHAEETTELLATAPAEDTGAAEGTRQEMVDEPSFTESEETPHSGGEAPGKTPRLSLKTFPEWEWILIIVALVVAAIMISVGLLSF